jgi:hypothetical protein
LGVEVGDGGPAVDRVVAGPAPVAALREVPAGPGPEVDERLVAAGGDHDHGVGLGDGLDPAADGGGGVVRRRLRTGRRTGRSREHRLDDLVEPAAHDLDAVAAVHVVGAGPGQALPHVVVGEQVGDAGRHPGGVLGDERVLALHEVQPLRAGGCRDHRGVGHHRLQDLALHAGAVEEGHDGDP